MSAVHDRLAGGLYLTVVVAGLFSLLYVPSQVPLPVQESAAVVLARMAEHEALYRLGLAAFMLKQVAFALLPLALWERLHPAGETAAAAMVVLAVVSVPIALVALTGRMQLLALTAPDAPTLAPAALQALVAGAQATYGQGLWVAQLFWGLWLAPLGWLMWRTRAVPRLLAACLLAGAAGYLWVVMAPLLAPAWAERVPHRWVMWPAAVGEIGTALWLLAVGWAGLTRPR